MKAAFWLVVNAIQAVYVVLWTLIWVPLALVVLLVTFNRKYPLAMARNFWAAGMVWGARVRLEVIGLENIDHSKSQVFVCNHQSMIDIPILFKAIPVNLHFVIKKELRLVPLIGTYAWAMGMVFVDRKQQSFTLASVRKIVQILRDGRSVIAFPEGTRSRGQGIRPFKKGIFFAAAEAGVPIVPLTLVGADQVLPSDHFALRPGMIRVVIGKPFPTAGLSEQQRNDLPETIRKLVMQLHQRYEHT